MKINQRGYTEEFYYYPIKNWDKSLKPFSGQSPVRDVSKKLIILCYF